jgi:P-type E1-E2 ATPase
VTEVVPGDLAVLSAGDMVPADGLTLEAYDIFVKQALLTGESYPVEQKRHNSVSSRNVRFAALRAFLKFASHRDPSAFQVIEQALTYNQV